MKNGRGETVMASFRDYLALACYFLDRSMYKRVVEQRKSDEKLNESKITTEADQKAISGNNKVQWPDGTNAPTNYSPATNEISTKYNYE